MYKEKDWLTTLLLCFFLGFLGAHSFYTGKIFVGIVQLLTLGGFGLWVIYDLILILDESYLDANDHELVRKPFTLF